MAENCAAPNIKPLLDLLEHTDLHHRRFSRRYDPGKLLHLKVKGVFPAVEGHVRLRVEQFAGGGFAGQVYRTTLLELDPPHLASAGLRVGGTYAVKIHVPLSRFSRRFRNLIYWLGYQGPFSAQVDANAARSGALWQKLIRRGAKCRFGDERCVADVHATFFDPEMGSFGEIIEWVAGRTWRLEIDREVFNRRERVADKAGASKEYLAKKGFMARLVRLFHDMGATELARQYEWWTAKSQPNVFKRNDPETGTEQILTALDFRPGLALLCFLPMSPADFKLILQGCRRGDLVQFDRGNFEALHRFCREHAEEFEDLLPALEELKDVDSRYRNSLPDLTHHGFRLLHDKNLRQQVKDGLIRGWNCLGLIDEAHAGILRTSIFAFWLFWLIAAVPFLGKRLRRLWGNSDYRTHLGACLRNPDYLRRALRVGQAACLLDWLRTGRVGERGVEFFLRHSLALAAVRVVPGLLPLPRKMHRMLIDWKYASERARAAVAFPVRFYRHPDFRLAWLNNEVEEGAEQGFLKVQEKERIQSQLRDPFIQKYLKGLAVHFCTFPTTRVVMTLVAVYFYLNYGNSWEESLAYALAGVAVVGVLPISPGSLVRGSYVGYLMVKERNAKDYWFAALVSFWHYVGYLGFPLQMVKKFPFLARLIASRWVRSFVKVVPVFGEPGALLEHAIFDLCVNVPLSIKRKIELNNMRRASVDRP